MKLPPLQLSFVLIAFFLDVCLCHAALLEVDLSVVNQITITATSEASAVTVSGSDGTGFYLENLFGVNTTTALFETALSGGDLTSFSNSSDGTPQIFVAPSDPGLNVWSYTNDAASQFTDGVQAFSGSATWNVNSSMYALALLGPESGGVYFVAGSLADVDGAELLGTWTVVPEPSHAAILAGALAVSMVLLNRRRL
ncbi:MAG: PEP-CTERM sorting domain-containing protein [Opitutaceae bacterium]